MTPDGAYQRLAAERRSQEQYRNRLVHVRARLTSEEAVITLKDQGPGFDPKVLPDPTDPENIGKISGRGLLLIRTFMDDVYFNETGNEITLIKRRSV
jgi:anti-sigma regulatory factor (Ser/Thr protein kinase)